MGYRQLTLQLTEACDIRCAHCCDAHNRVDLDPVLAEKAIAGLARLGRIDCICFTGGEPFLRYKTMLRLAAYAQARGLASGVVTNARWAKSAEVAMERLGALARLGLDVVVVSHDPYHAAFVPDECVQRVLDAAAELGLATQIYYSRGDAKRLRDIERDVSARFGLAPEQVAIRDILPVGHAADLPPAPHALPYRELDKQCPIQDQYNVSYLGDVYPCCSAGTHEALAFGNIGRESVKAIVDRRLRSRLHEMLQRHDLGQIVLRLPPEVRDRIASRHYLSACHLCNTLMADPEARAAAARIDPDAIGLIEKLLLAPILEAELPQPKRRTWRGPPVVAGN